MITLILISFLSLYSPAQTRTMPNTCKELLPELSPYIEFMEQIGASWIEKSPKKAKKVYDALAIRTLYQETTRDYINPIDKMLKDFLCTFYKNNNENVFSADSNVAREYINKNIDTFIKEATKKYVDLKLKIYEEELAGKINKKMAQKIENMKASSIKNIEKSSNIIFNKKKKKLYSK
jgi:hypothetical protein